MINKGDPIYMGMETATMWKKPGPGRAFLGWSNIDGLFEGEALCLKCVTRTKPNNKQTPS